VARGAGAMTALSLFLLKVQVVVAKLALAPVPEVGFVLQVGGLDLSVVRAGRIRRLHRGCAPKPSG